MSTFKTLAPAIDLSYFKGRMKRIKQTIVMLLMLVAVAAPVFNSPVAFAAQCGDVETSIISGDVCEGTSSEEGGQNSPIWGILLLVLNILTSGVGIAAVGGIVYGAILYSSAGDKADQTKKAIGVITNVVIGIIAYALMYLVLNFLIPGGIFS